MANKDQLLIIVSLQNIVENLGRVYMDMAENYPKLIDLMDNKFNSLCSKNEKNCDTFGSLEDMESSTAKLHNIVNSEAVIFSDLSEKDSVFLSLLEKELNKTSLFKTHIEEIQDDSAELELISLNAMVTALKAGKNGGAFPYITEELQSVSKSSALLSKSLQEYGDNMNNVFREYLDDIQEDKKGLSNSMESISSNINSLLELIKDYKNKIYSLIQDLQDGIQGIRTPLYHIIQEVQKHDIVRQSIDHVILSFEKAEDNPHQTLEEELDYLSFKYQIYSFCKEILSEIETGLNETYSLFKDKSDDLSKLMVVLKSSGQAFLVQNSNDSYSLRIREFQNGIFSSIELFKKGYKRDNLKKRMDKLMSEISKLEESSSGFVRIINWIKTINIASRVEAAKLPHLENMGFIIESIRERTDSIENNVEFIIKVIADFRKQTNRLFIDYFKGFSADTLKLDKFILDLKTGLTAVTDSHNSVDQSTMAVVNVSHNFDDFYQQTQDDLKSMKSLIDNLGRVNLEVEAQRVELKTLMDQALADSPYSKWELKGNEIKNLIDKFTIFIHKKKADLSSNLLIEDEGASSGEITLF
ncbi:MAG: hypothetical protein B6241_05465 [Spirochaetaceae bacterium 4572_59]|nr:MAG: hypothetical protein B6241_05465 [Spirochaetaceae bacterium 4572_59]